VIGVYQQKALNLFKTAKHAIEECFKQDVVDLGFLALPDNSFDPLRQQYNASVIVKHVASKSEWHGYNKLYLVHADIYVPKMNFIFGLADPLLKTAVVSTYRLDGELYEERIAKEIIHEIGHLYGLDHCQDHDCIMRFSQTVADTDEKKKAFCAYCRSQIE
jgi:archaemetzincin